ncbi:U31-like protein 1 [Lissonota sp. PSUC_FEM 10030012]|nr:U31-like protein 1 [Lissonota sp. PSUC_FEM 10030012]
MASLLDEFCDFVSAARSIGEESDLALADVLKNSSSLGKVMELGTEGATPTLTVNGFKMTVTDFVENLMKEDASVMANLKASLSPDIFEELQNSVRASHGLSESSVEAVSMMKDMRQPMKELAGKTMSTLEEAAKTEEGMMNEIKAAAGAGKGSKFAKAWENLKAGMGKVGEGGKAVLSSKYFAALVVPGLASLSVYEFLGYWAEKHSGCYMFEKGTSTKCRVTQLSGGMPSTKGFCSCELTQATKDSREYTNFENNKSSCEQHLCVNKSFMPPYNDKKRYTFSCIQLNRWDALCDVTVDIASGVVDTVENIASLAYHKVLPVALICGGIYMAAHLYLNRPQNSSAEKSVERLRPDITSDYRKNKGKRRKVRRKGYVRLPEENTSTPMTDMVEYQNE